MVKEGRPFGITNQTFLLTQLRGTDPFQPLREAYQNAVEANASRVVISWDSAGYLTICDDGIGMSPDELEKYNKDFGASSKSVSESENFGVGLKLACMLASVEELSVISRKKGSRARFAMSSLGPVPGGFGQIQFDNKTYVRFTDHNRSSPFNTIVRIEGLDLKAMDIVRYFNQRYLTLPIPIIIEEQKGKKSVCHTCEGLLHSLRNACKEYGQIDLGPALVYWGIVDEEEKELRRGYSWKWASLSLGFENETYHCRQRSESSILGRYGISFGDRNIALIVIAKAGGSPPQNPRWDFDRSGITGWDEVQTQRLFLEELPAELDAYQRYYKMKHTDDDIGVRNYIEELYEVLSDGLALPDGRIVDEDEKKNGAKPPGGKPGKSNASGSNEGKPKKSKEGTGKKSPMPEFHFGDQEVTGPKPIKWDETAWSFTINNEYDEIARCLEIARDDTELKDMKILICVEILLAWSKYHQKYGEFPDETQLEMTVFGSVAPWLRREMSNRSSVMSMLKKQLKKGKK